MTNARKKKFNVITDGTLITDSLGAVGSTWVKVESSPATLNASNDILYNGGQTLRLQCPAVAGASSYATKAVNLNMTGVTHISIAMWVGDIILSTGSSLTIYFITSTPGTADLRSISFTAQKPGWNIVTRPVSVASSTGSPDWANIRQIRVRVDSSASVARDICFGGLWMNKRCRPKVSISFDDGYDDGLAVDTICTARKLPVSYGIIPSLIDAVSGEYLTTAELTTLAGSPYAEIICHDVDRWSDDVYSVSGAEGLKARIQSIQSYVQQFDPVGWQYAVYPEGDYGYTEQRWKNFLPEFRKLGFKAVRMVVPTTVEIPFMMDEAIGTGDPLLLPAFIALKNTTSLAAAKALVDSTVRYGGTAFVYGHKLDAVADSLTWVTADFTSLMDYIVGLRNSGHLDVEFFSDWFLTANNGGSSN